MLFSENYERAQTRNISCGVKEISAEKRFVLTLWYLANTDTFREISNLFDVSLSSAHRSIVSVTHWLVRHAHKHIKWPREEAEQIDIENKFQQNNGFPHVLGTIDGSHIQIRKPQENAIDYYNRKKYYSILLQGVVGPDRKFYDIHVGEPGSMHDGRMLKKTELYKKCAENPELLLNSQRVILGDSAYPCLSWLIPPFRDLGNLSDAQKLFNKKHSATRVVVEHAFGLLKNKFRRLNKFENFTIDFVVNCVIAACVLHNICIDKNDVIEIEEIDPAPEVTIEENIIIEENTIRRQELLQELFPGNN